MLVIHAGIEHGRLLLWGESPESEGASSKKAAKGTGAPRSPFDSGFVKLLEACSHAAPDLQPHEAKTVKAGICLPTVAKKPFSSNPLISAPPKTTGKVQLSAWKVSALALKTTHALDFLCACIGRETLGRGVLIGADVAFWTKALQFAAALVVRQQFLPDIDLSGGQARAIWRPIFAASDASRLTLLSRSMPDACRAVAVMNETDEPPTTPASTVLSNFITELTDKIVRSLSVGLSFRKTNSRRKPSF